MSGPAAGAPSSEWRAGWTLVLAAMVGFSVSTLPAGSTGVMMQPLEQDLGWSRTQIYSGVSLISFIAMALSGFMGAAIDRIGARRIALAATLVLCAGIAGLALVRDALWQWWLGWAVVGVAAATMPTVWLAPLAARFIAARGLAVAIVLSGSGIATFLVPIIAHTLVEHHGWRGAYVGLAAIWGAIALPLVYLWFRVSPAPASGGAATPGADQRSALPGLSVREGFASASFWKLAVGAFCGLFGGVALVMNLVPVLVSGGIAKGSAATISGLIGISTIAGRVAGGWLMDRMSARHIAALSTAVAVVLPTTLLAAPGSVVAAAGAVIAYGLFGGAKIGALAYLASRHLGQRAFGTLYGSINAFVAFAVASAPLAANMIYDATRSYELVMWAAIPVALVGALAYLVLGAYPDFAARQGDAG